MKFQEQSNDISNTHKPGTGEMITERKVLGVVDSNVTRIQPKRAAKTGHKWFTNRPQKSDERNISITKSASQNQHYSYLQRSMLQNQNESKEIFKERMKNTQSFLSECPNTKHGSYESFKQCDNYDYRNRKCPFRLPLQTLSFRNGKNSTLDNTTVHQENNGLLFPSTVKEYQPNSSDSCTCADSDVSLRSIPEDDLSEIFLNKPQSLKKDRKKTKVFENESQSQFSKTVEIVEEYLPDILLYMRESEVKYRPKKNYLEKQAEVTSAMRVKLTDWLIEVQDEYKLHNETLYLAIAFVDRFLSEMSVTRGKLQLLGTASMFLAAKIEEVYPPDANEFAYVTADTYTRNEVLLMERMILNVLECSLAVPTLFQYLNIFHEKSNLEEEMQYLSFYVSEITLIDENYLQYLPSVKAAAAITLAMFTIRYSHYCDIANGNLESQAHLENVNVKNGSHQMTVLGFPDCICHTIRHVMATSVEEIYGCVLDMANSHLHVSNSTHFVREKYLTSAQKSVAKITPLLADASLNASVVLSWNNITGMWQT